MPPTTRLLPNQILPLTCSRLGTCCHGKMVRLNPWELQQIAKARGFSPMEFRDRFCEWGGIKLKFNGPIGWNNQNACSQYQDQYGCVAHSGRPLACRLYPLGRQIQGNDRQYIFQGRDFPCLEGCPEVLQLPLLSVADYVAGQQVDIYEESQNEYIEVMQNLADDALTSLLETGLSRHQQNSVIKLWRCMGKEDPELLSNRLQVWRDLMTLPNCRHEDIHEFAQDHYNQMTSQVQAQLNQDPSTKGTNYLEISVVLMGISLHLARAVGANPESLAERWIFVAQENLTK